MNYLKNILKIINIITVIILLYYFKNSLSSNTDRLDEFTKKQELYERKMDSLRVISEELIKNISVIDSKINNSKKSIDELKKKPMVINFTNTEALDFLRQFALKYNTIFRDSLQ